MTEGVRSACVIGWPVKHSRSPLIHEYWIKHYGIAATYRREEVMPEAFAGFIATLVARGYIGANVTLPHKEEALTLSEPDDRAHAVGAANTLWLEDGQLHSTNTDVEGFTANLDASVPGWDAHPENAVVLGAGGAARAIICGMIERDFKRIHVVNRTLGRAEALRERFGEFQASDNLQRLFTRLEELFLAMQRSRLFEALLVDGSFVTAKPAPNDIDLVAVLLPGHDFERDLPMSEYALVSRTMLRRRYGFDVVVAEKNSELCTTYVEFFSRGRDNPDVRKICCD